MRTLSFSAQAPQRRLNRIDDNKAAVSCTQLLNVEYFILSCCL